MHGEIDFQRDPWPRISEDAKDLVKGMLEPNPYSRLTVEEVLGTNKILCHQFFLLSNDQSYDIVSICTVKKANGYKMRTRSPTFHWENVLGQESSSSP